MNYIFDKTDQYFKVVPIMDHKRRLLETCEFLIKGLYGHELWRYNMGNDFLRLNFLLPLEIMVQAKEKILKLFNNERIHYHVSS